MYVGVRESGFWVDARVGNWCRWEICLHTEHGILAVMGIGLFGRVELIELEYVVDEFLLAGGGGTGWMGTLG